MDRKNQEYILSKLESILIHISSLKRIFSVINCKDSLAAEQQITIDEQFNSAKLELEALHNLFIHKYIAKD